jgi:hypothetical protein
VIKIDVPAVRPEDLTGLVQQARLYGAHRFWRRWQPPGRPSRTPPL